MTPRGFAGPGILVSTPNRIAKFVDVINTTGDSVLFEDNDRIGLGLTSNINQTFTVGASQSGSGSGAAIGIYSTHGDLNSRNWAIQNGYDNFGDLEFRVSNAKSGNPDAAGRAMLTLLSDGNAGIGTSSPRHTLTLSAGMSGGSSGSGLGLYSTHTNSGSRNWAILNGYDNFGDLEFRVSTSRGLHPDGFQFGQPTGTVVMSLLRDGKVGIATSTPPHTLSIFAETSGAASGPGLALYSTHTNTSSRNWGILTAYDNFGDLEFRVSNAKGGNPSGTTGTSVMALLSNGNVGIGTTAPASKLHVNGNVTVTGSILSQYQDVAEWVDTPSAIEPGTVVIIDPDHIDNVVPAARAYDTRVAGAVSRQPGVVLGEATPTGSLVAQSGRVRVKVDATYGAAKIGDVLVTSPTPGHAMVSKPITVGGIRMHRPSTVLGKALEAWPDGKGEILVLLTLQ